LNHKSSPLARARARAREAMIEGIVLLKSGGPKLH